VEDGRREVSKIACAIIASTALVVTSFADDKADRWVAAFLVIVFAVKTFWPDQDK
jgi:hypothetical protein